MLRCDALASAGLRRRRPRATFGEPGPLLVPFIAFAAGSDRLGQRKPIAGKRTKRAGAPFELATAEVVAVMTGDIIADSE